MRYSILFSVYLAACLSIITSCSRRAHDPEYFIHCKIDGQKFLPNNCANCMRAQILGDTVFLLNSNAGFETVRMGIIKLDKVPITTTAYMLSDIPQFSGQYDNSPQVTDIFKTDTSRTGLLTITILDKTNRIVSGTFSSEAYNPVQRKTVSVTEGKFRLKFTAS